MFWTISALSSLYFGSTSYPNLSITLLVSIATFRALATVCDAINNPCKKLLFEFRDGPISFPSPGAVSLSAHNSTKSFLPTIYAPFDAIPPPKFFISDPTQISAPISIGSLYDTNSQ